MRQFNPVHSYARYIKDIDSSEREQLISMLNIANKKRSFKSPRFKPKTKRERKLKNEIVFEANKNFKNQVIFKTKV